MIWLTRLNGDKFVLNADHIELVEAKPDTTILLTNGDKYIVKEGVEEVINEIIEYKRKIFLGFEKR